MTKEAAAEIAEIVQGLTGMNHTQRCTTRFLLQQKPHNAATCPDCPCHRKKGSLGKPSKEKKSRRAI